MMRASPIVLVLAACGGKDAPVAPTLPDKIAAFHPKPVTPNAEIELGRVLFFDPRLSGDNTMSCATCHVPEKAFTDGVARSKGKGGKLLRRNTPDIANIADRAPYFWDGRAATPEEQALGPVTSADEMAQDPAELVEELRGVPEYVARFEEAYAAEISIERLGKAVAAFERTLFTANAPLDRYLDGDVAAMSPEALRGFALFVSKGECVKCHDGPHLTDASFHNIGLRGDDKGRFEVQPIPALEGAFKTPGLRDVALTAPYFHDGSAATLLDVVEHYNRGGDVAKNRDKDIRPLKLTAAEKSDLVAFMHALTGTRTKVLRPRIPNVVEQPRDITTIDLMKDVDGMLDNLDGLVANLDGNHWAQASGAIDRLLAISEELAALRDKALEPSQRAEARKYVGYLIVELGRLREAILAQDSRRARGLYDAVRKRCENCHTVFRKER